MRCEKVQTYNYNHAIGHSECVNCGGRFGVNENNAVLIHFQKRINKIITIDYNIEKLKNKINNQRKVIVGLRQKIRILEGKK